MAIIINYFLLEAVKAREAIKLIKEYKKTGKKIVSIS